MNDDHDLREFRNVCRLFPLPGVVLFPHSVLPLHIFEPRYRQMTEDALHSDRFVTIVQPRLENDEPCGDPLPLEPVACLGKVLNCERLANGRFNFLLLGLKRVRLIREVSTDRLYRQAEAELLDDDPPEEPEEPRRSDLIHLFRTVSLRQEVLDPDLAQLLETGLSLGALTDIVAHAMGLPPAIKQAFLADCCVERRADGLIDILRQFADRVSGGGATEASKPFPPPFSIN
ncbi:MAG TPA: LON peptidase substrate-binding domain-containing protein [Isosphaeraceae bacterium]|nr:LON peptidase substrate-binding domain-containing protein [Isosphaeraceae bacterium]